MVHPAATDPQCSVVAWPSRPVIGCLVLLLVYLVVSLAVDPRGHLATDTGGKAATLEAMDLSGSLDPDIGYWAVQWDDLGELHPYFYTEEIDGRFVNVTTMPLVLVALPLYRSLGPRGALLVPMLGAIVAALAAAALARRLGGSPPLAFWLVGLASPVVVYALDIWEHSWGLALMAWGVVLLVDVVRRDAGAVAAAAAGGLFALAATMRTEAFVYGAVFGGCALAVLWRRHSFRSVVPAGLAAAMAAGIVLVANRSLEATLIGSTLRDDRTGDAASRLLSDPWFRLQEGLVETFAVNSSEQAWAAIAGGVVVVLLIGTVSSGRLRGTRATLAVAMVAMLVVGRFAVAGLGFVPGVLVAAPIAVVGLWNLDDREDVRWLGVAAVASLPIVWAFQFLGGAGPQWGGRYVLLSGLVLTVIGIGVLERMPMASARLLIALSFAVTSVGVLWTVHRTRSFAEAFEEVARHDDPVLVSRIAFLLRESGAAGLGERWLTATDDTELRRAAEVVEAAGFDTFVVLEGDGAQPVTPIEGWRGTPKGTIELLDGDVLRLVDYRRLEPGSA
jgi:hypothetical protein